MSIHRLEPGDIVVANQDIINDGSFPDLQENALLVSKGTRGVIVNIGHLEENNNQAVFLVKFEDITKQLGPPIGCWPEDLAVLDLH